MDVMMLKHALPVRLDLIFKTIFANLNAKLVNFGILLLQLVKTAIPKQPYAKNAFLKPISA
jgi:hypothetical protein